MTEKPSILPFDWCFVVTYMCMNNSYCAICLISGKENLQQSVAVIMQIAVIQKSLCFDIYVLTLHSNHVRPCSIE